MDETPLQREIRECSQRIWAEQRKALDRCKSQYEWDQCFRAYAALYWEEVDVISQRYGMQPMLRRAPQ